MLIDLCCAAVIALFALIGYFAGFWIQLARLASLAGAYLLALLIAPRMRGVVESATGLGSFSAKVVAMLALFTITYAILSTLSYVLLRRRRKVMGRHLSADLLAGAFFGGIKATLFCYLLISCLVLLEAPLAKVVEHGALGYRSSWAVKVVRRNNVLGHLQVPIAGDLDTLARLSDDPRLRARASRDPQVKRLMRHPKVKKAFSDPELQKALRRGDLSALLSDPRVEALLEDPELRELVKGIDLRRLQ